MSLSCSSHDFANELITTHGLKGRPSFKHDGTITQTGLFGTVSIAPFLTQRSLLPRTQQDSPTIAAHLRSHAPLASSLTGQAVQGGRRHPRWLLWRVAQDPGRALTLRHAQLVAGGRDDAGRRDAAEHDAQVRRLDLRAPLRIEGVFGVPSPWA